MFKEQMLDYLTEEKAEMEKEGLIPTLDEALKRLAVSISTDKFFSDGMMQSHYNNLPPGYKQSDLE